MRCERTFDLKFGNNLVSFGGIWVDEVCDSDDNCTSYDDIQTGNVDSARTLSTPAFLNAIAEKGGCGTIVNGNYACMVFILGEGSGLFNPGGSGWTGNLNNLTIEDGSEYTAGYWLNITLNIGEVTIKGECAYDPYVEDPEQYCEEGGYGGGCENETDECYNPDIYDLCPTGDYACATAENCNELFPPDPIPDFPSIYIQGNILCTDEEAPHPDCTAAGELILVYNFFGYTGETGDFIQIMENSFYSIIGLANYDIQNGTDVAATGIIPEGLTPQDICGGPCWANGTTVNTNYYDSLGDKFDGANSVAIIPGLGPVWNLFGPSSIESGRGYYVFTDTAGYLKW